MKKGIIMEMDDEFLTLLTPEGEFLHTKRLNQLYAVGEEIHFFPMERVNTSSSFNPLKNIFKFKPVWAFIAVFVLLLGSFFPMYQNNKAYAYMSIDVNPSIELAVNKKMQVVEITGFNKDGKKIVSHIKNWKKKNVSELAKTIIAEMNKEGYLSTKEHIIISTARTIEPEVKAEKELKENIEEIKASIDKQKVELTVLNATQEEWKKAHKLGITTGKYQENQASVNETKSVKTKEQKKQDDSIPVEPIKKQKENKALQNKEFTETKKPVTKKRVNGKIIPPGQWKKNEENKSKQNQGQAKKQKNQKEKKSESKKSLKKEESKEKAQARNTIKNKNWKNNKRNNVKSNNAKKSKSKEKDTNKDHNKSKKKIFWESLK